MFLDPKKSRGLASLLMHSVWRDLAHHSYFNYDFFISISLMGLFWRCSDKKKCSSWFLDVIILHFVHWFQNCAQLNQSNRANIPGFSLADCRLLESYQPMRNQYALNVMLRFNWAQFWNQWTKYRIITLRYQLEHFFVYTSRVETYPSYSGIYI